MSSSTANAAWTKVLDTAYDSKVLQGLLRILPETFRIVVGTADFTGGLDAGDSVAVNDASGNPILLTAGETIIGLNVVATTDTSGSGTGSFGLSSVAAGTNIEAAVDILPAVTVTEMNDGHSLANETITTVQVAASQQYLIAESTAGGAAIAEGVVKVVAIIV